MKKYGRSKLRGYAGGGIIGAPTGYAKPNHEEPNPGVMGFMYDGGEVEGPGGPTADKVGPVMLSDGEYVLPADTVDAVGVDALEQLRKATHKPVKPNLNARGVDLKKNRAELSKLRASKEQMADGGMVMDVDMGIPGYKHGGLHEEDEKLPTSSAFRMIDLSGGRDPETGKPRNMVDLRSEPDPTETISGGGQMNRRNRGAAPTTRLRDALGGVSDDAATTPQPEPVAPGTATMTGQTQDDGSADFMLDDDPQVRAEQIRMQTEDPIQGGRDKTYTFDNAAIDRIYGSAGRAAERGNTVPSSFFTAPNADEINAQRAASESALRAPQAPGQQVFYGTAPGRDEQVAQNQADARLRMIAGNPRLKPRTRMAAEEALAAQRNDRNELSEARRIRSEERPNREFDNDLAAFQAEDERERGLRTDETVRRGQDIDALIDQSKNAREQRRLAQQEKRQYMQDLSSSVKDLYPEDPFTQRAIIANADNLSATTPNPQMAAAKGAAIGNILREVYGDDTTRVELPRVKLTPDGKIGARDTGVLEKLPFATLGRTTDMGVLQRFGRMIPFVEDDVFGFRDPQTGETIERSKSRFEDGDIERILALQLALQAQQ